MKAIVATKYGSTKYLQLLEIDKPTPKDNEILVKIYASTVTSGDVTIRKLKFPVYPIFLLFARVFFGMKNLRKKVLGHEVAGEIEEIGNDVEKFKVGDQIFGSTTGLTGGGHAEYICLPEDGLVSLKPSTMTYNEAAAVPIGGMTALQILKKANIQKGQKVLIYGASGSVGTFAVQISKHYRAEVTGVCSITNLEMVSSLGVNQVIDYTKNDFTKNGETYDVIFDAVGKISKSSSKKSLAKNGIYLSVQSSTKEELEDLIFLKELVEQAKLVSVIDSQYPLEQTAEAHRYVEKGHKSGNLVITVVQTDD
ncbi:MAG: NAD(P)-dependent alcohol dehydrogenase [Candidatus Heimdallarchaeota archaeon]|nr:NAD(P)-dependent alcohol dehydrogenase [Candidatus Heimdallarchaeota archaeon]